ncbi:MAG: GntR family transcriptional regulator, partial [Deltaproteobacteria bacterium]
QVHSLLHHLIVHCVLPPGSPIREKDLSEQMEVSRTPIREALLQLEKEGLVEIYPQAGTRISKISMEEVRESHFIREAMESATVRFAAQQGDSELNKKLKSRLQQFKDSLETAEKDLLFELDELFHKTIAEFRFQNRLWKITNIAKSHMDRVRHLTLPLPKRIYEIADEHQRVADFIIRHQPDEAVRAIQDHLSVIFSDIERIRAEHSEYFVP